MSLKEDGKVYRLRARPAAKDDKELRKICGFDGAVTTSIYDGTGKVARVDTWKDGVIQKQGAGTSDYASRSEVAFKDGKKQGEERVLGKDGKLAAIINWDRGVKEGKEIVFAEGGKKVVKEIVWKAGEMTQVTELYLNGNPSLKETYADPKKKQVQAFWDTGKVSAGRGVPALRIDELRVPHPGLVRGRRPPVLLRERRARGGGDLPARQAPGAQPELVGERQARERRGLRRRQADPGQALGQGRQAPRPTTSSRPTARASSNGRDTPPASRDPRLGRPGIYEGLVSRRVCEPFWVGCGDFKEEVFGYPTSIPNALTRVI